MRPVADFLGIPERGVIAIGKVTVAAGALEEVVQDISHALGGAPGNQPFMAVVRELRRLLTTELPSHARVTGTDIQMWTERVVSAMDDRDRWAHSAYKKIFKGDAWEPIAQHIRSGERSGIDDKAEDHAKRLAKLAHEGREHLIGLRPEVRKGVFWGKPRHDDGSWITIKYLDDEGRWPDRPSDAELDELWEQWVSQSEPP